MCERDSRSLSCSQFINEFVVVVVVVLIVVGELQTMKCVVVASKRRMT